MRSDKDSDGTPPRDGARRKPYRSPRLQRLGTLTEITASVGSSSNKTDHAGPQAPLRKTS